MIVVSLLFIVVSGGLLAAGISSAADGLVITSIGVSLLAAGALFLGIRQQRDVFAEAAESERGANPRDLVPPASAVGAVSVGRPVSAAEDEPTVPSGLKLGGAGVAPPSPAPGVAEEDEETVVTPLSAAVRPTSSGEIGKLPEQTRRSSKGSTAVTVAEDPAEDFEDPSDEPPAESRSPSDAAQLSRLDAEVLVVDGRPRYHLGSCPHLLGRQAQPLGVAEAVELGFTSCSQCSAASTLLAGG